MSRRQRVGVRHFDARCAGLAAARSRRARPAIRHRGVVFLRKSLGFKLASLSRNLSGARDVSRRCRTKRATDRWRRPVCQRVFVRRRPQGGVKISSPIKGNAVPSILARITRAARRGARICAKYPGASWRDLEDRSAYPTSLSRTYRRGIFRGTDSAGYGGAGLPIRAAAASLEEINIRAARDQCHAQMYIWARCCGTATPSRSSAICRARARRIAPAGIGRDRATTARTHQN